MMDVLTESFRLLSSVNPFKLGSPLQQEEPKREEITEDFGSSDSSASGDSRRSQGYSSRQTPHACRSDLASSFLTKAVSSEGNLSDSMNGGTPEIGIIRKQFLEVAHMLGESSETFLVQQVMHRLSLAEQIKWNQIKRGSRASYKLKLDKQKEYTCTVLVLGKSGMGKSATINSIFGEYKSATNASNPGTKHVCEIVGHVRGLKLRIIDTPGLMPSFYDYCKTGKILSRIKKFTRRVRPDVVLYVDRLDIADNANNDYPLLKVITEKLGASVWYNSFIVLTHSSSVSSAKPYEYHIDYDTFIAQRLRCIQNVISNVVHDMRLRIPISLVENHQLFQHLPVGFGWKAKLLLHCFAIKAISEADAVIQWENNTIENFPLLQHKLDPTPSFLSLLMQPRYQAKTLQQDASLFDLCDFDNISDSDDVNEFDVLPPFKHLTKPELKELTQDQKKAYYDELDYREKLFLRKQLKEEMRRIKIARSEDSGHESLIPEENAADGSAPANILDFEMPPSFDCDDSGYRYRVVENVRADEWIIKPALNPNGWDHDCGFEGVGVQKVHVINDRYAANFSAQIQKDTDYNDFQVKCSCSLEQGKGQVTTIDLNVDKVGREHACTLFWDTSIRNLQWNVTTGRLALMFLRDAVLEGLKIEDTLRMGNLLQLTLNGGAVMGAGEMIPAGSLQVMLRDKDYPLVNRFAKLGISVMCRAKHLGLSGDFSSELAMGRNLAISNSLKLNSDGSGKINFNVTSSGKLHLAAVALIPIIRRLSDSFHFKHGC